MEIKVGDYVRFVNGNFLVGVVTKISENGYATIIDQNGGMETYKKEILVKYSTNVSIKSMIYNLLKNIKIMKMIVDKED